MAQPLTWRNVDAPDFRGSLAGLQVAAGAMDRAFTGLSEGLGQFRDYNRDAAESAVLNNALGFSDPAQLRAAIADGRVFQGVDRGLLGRQALTALNSQAGTLLEQAVAQQGLSTSQQLDPIRVRQAGLNADQTQQTIGHNAVMQPLLQDQQRTSNNRGVWALGVDQRNDADTQTGQGAATEAIRNALSADQAVASLESNPNLSAGARRIAMEEVQRRFPGAYGAAPAVAGGPAAPRAAGSGGASAAISAAVSAPGTAGTQRGSAYDVTYRFTPTANPITTMPIGQVIEHQRRQMIPTLGASPVGAFQINADTLADFAPRVLGDNWREQRLTPENQERIAEAIFEARKAGDLTQTWAALPDNRPGAYANRSWGEVRGEIARREVGADLEGPRRQAAANAAAASRVTSDTEGRASQERATGVAGQYPELAQSRATVEDVVRDLRKPGGSFERVDPGVLRSEIQWIMGQDNRINAAMAGALVNRFTDDINHRAWFTRMFGARDYPILNRDAVSAEIRSLAEGTRHNQARSLGALEASAQSVQTAAAQANEAQAALHALRNRAQVAPGVRQHLPAVEAQAAQAQRILEETLGRNLALQNRAPDFSPVSIGRRPEGAPAAPGTTRTTGGGTANRSAASAAIANAAGDNPSPAAETAAPEVALEQAGQQLDAARQALADHRRTPPPRPPGLQARRVNPEVMTAWQEQQAAWEARDAQLRRDLALAESAYGTSLPDNARRAFAR